jgi:hypothetical protein
MLMNEIAICGSKALRKGTLVLGLALVGALFLVVGSLATPSTQIWNPSTDIQAIGTTHFGIDNYFVFGEPGYAAPTDLGLTYGAIPGLEIGIDAFVNTTSPFYLNAKYGITESDLIPSLAIGGFGFGTQTGVTDQNVLYAVAAKTFGIGRITLGGYSGNQNVLGSDNTGVIATWDKYVTDKLWLCVDYSSGQSFLGALFYGLSYNFSANTSVIFGYGTYNNGAPGTFTTQLDINI